MVGSEYGAAMFVCIYVSKTEPEELMYILHEILEKITSDASPAYPPLHDSPNPPADQFARGSVPSW